jgi:hypothetical protein
VSVAWAPGNAVYGVQSATLTPTGSPGGVIALKVVREGQVRTLAKYRFRALRGLGSVQLDVVRRAIDASWSLPGSGTGSDGQRVEMPRGSRAFDNATSGNLVEPGEDGEQTIWAQTRYVGAMPSGGGLSMGSFDGLVSDSLQYPRRTIYCLTLRLDGK